MISQAILVAKERQDDGRWRLVVVFIDESAGTKAEKDFFATSILDFRRQVLRYVHTVADSDEVAKVLQLAPIDITPDPVIPPTQEELDKQAFFVLVEKRRRAQTLIDVHAIQPDNKTVADLESALQASFKPEYIG